MSARRSARLEELDWQPTPAGEITLRRRQDPSDGTDIYEVKLGEDYLMSSLFTFGETELARLGLARLDRSDLEVVVGGLGLGYTAAAALTDARINELVVVDALEPVLDWHRRGLVPLGAGLTADPRCRLVLGDFFALSAADGWDPEAPGRLFDAVLVDIDHSPRHHLTPGEDPRRHAFYSVAGTAVLASRLRPDGVYALWSNDPPDESYLAVLRQVFTDATAEVVTFPNPLQGRTASNTLYLGVSPRAQTAV